MLEDVLHKVEESTLVYSSLQDLEADVTYCNNNVLIPGTCLIKAKTWKNSQQQNIASLDVMFFRNMKIGQFVDKSRRFRDNVLVTGRGYVEVTLDTDAKWTIVGKTSNVKGLSVGCVEDEWKQRYGMFSSSHSTLFGPVRAAQLLQYIHSSDDVKRETNYIHVDVWNMIDWVKEVYTRDKKYVVPSSMAAYLIKVCNVPEYRLLKTNNV